MKIKFYYSCLTAAILTASTFIALAKDYHSVFFGIQFTNLSIAADKADFRTAIVLDDVHGYSFKKLTVKEPESKKKIFTNNSSEIAPK